MINGNCNDSLAFGFLTALQDDRDGVFGGLLVLNALARPLEFHCTAPIKANRAQEILYGPTLREYLFAEQIGQTLVKHASSSISIICTDLPEMLAVRRSISKPIALVDDSSNEASGKDRHRFDEAHQLLPSISFQDHDVTVLVEYRADLGHIDDRLQRLGDSFDLLEPFDRIRNAIAEAQQSARSKAKHAHN